MFELSAPDFCARPIEDHEPGAGRALIDRRDK